MKASAMVAALIIIVVGSLITGGLLFFIGQENTQSRMLRDSGKALYIAEAGLEDVLGAIAYAIDTMEDPEDFLDEELEEIREDYNVERGFGGGSYSVWIYDDNPVNDESQSDLEWENYGLLRLISTGRYGTGEDPGYADTMIGKRRISRLVRVGSLWDSALFVGGNPSSPSASLNGIGQVRGTVYVLGETPFIDTNENDVFDSGIDYGGGPHLDPGDAAVGAGGTFYIGNNYETFGGNSGIPGEFESRIPPILLDELETLGAWLNVKYGQVKINSGSAQVGKIEETEDIKEYMDGIIVPDGIGGTHPQNVYTDVLYDDTNDRDRFPETLRLPSLYDTYTDPVTGITYNYVSGNEPDTGRMEYYQTNGLRVSIGVDGDPDTYDITDTSITPNSSFSFTDGTNTFSLDGSGNMVVSGIVYVTTAGGNPVIFGLATGPLRDINYQNRGVIVTPESIEFNRVNLYTSDPTGAPIPYPNLNAIGFMTPGDIKFNTNNTELMAFFYAGGTITTANNTNIAGSLMAQEVTIDLNSSIFQVNGSPPAEMRLGMPAVIWAYEWFEERYVTED